MISITNCQIINCGTGIMMGDGVDVYMSGTEISGCGKAVHILGKNSPPSQKGSRGEGYFRLNPVAAMVRSYLAK